MTRRRALSPDVSVHEQLAPSCLLFFQPTVVFLQVDLSDDRAHQPWAFSGPWNTVERVSGRAACMLVPASAA